MNDLEDYKIRFHPFTPGIKIPESFEYEENHKDIINFFNKDAKKCSEELISKIFIIKNENSDFVGYLALSLCSIKKNNLNKGKTRGLYDRPAIKIGQLIIDKNHQNKGYGSVAIKFVIAIIRTLKSYLPCRLLAVDAIDKNAKIFYEKKGFKKSPYEENTLILDIAPILRL